MTGDLVERLTNCPRPRAVLRAWDGSGWQQASWDEVVREAHEMAGGLRALGVERDVPVAAVLTNTPAAVRGILAVWLAGGTLASLPIRARGMSADAYAKQVRAIQTRLQSPLLLTSEALLGALQASVSESIVLQAWERLERRAGLDASPPTDDDIAFVQYSSGSTNTPKGCSLSARAIGRQLDIIHDLLGAGPGEQGTFCSWLPLSHDMGMFGSLLAPWAAGLDVWLSSPERFLMNQASWFADLAESGARFSVSPNMGLDIAVRAARGAAGLPGDLSALRAVVVGGERVEWRTLTATAETFAPCGFRSTMLQPAYGLAEATLAVTSVGVGEEPSMVTLDSVALAHGHLEYVAPEDPRATAVVCCGRPQSGCNVEIAGEGLAPIHVSSQSLADGYYRDPEQTADRFNAGVLDTRDVGFLRDGQLYVVGRSDDVLTVAGRKVYATEIESSIAALADVRTGCCTIVELRDLGPARLVMLLELNEDADPDGVAREAARIATAKAGVTISECVCLERGALPKTPSGKVQRFRVRHLLASGELEGARIVGLRAA